MKKNLLERIIYASLKPELLAHSDHLYIHLSRLTVCWTQMKDLETTFTLRNTFTAELKLSTK